MNIYDAVYQVNCSHPEKRAMSIALDNGENRVYTYGEVFQKADLYAERLTAAGIRAGDRVAFVCESCPEWTIAFLAVCKLCCTAVLLDASLSGETLMECIRFSDVRAAFFSEKASGKLPAHALKFPVFRVLDGTVFPDSPVRVPDSMPQTPDPDEEVACILFSSGTTRKAAGILHTHDALIETTRMTLEVQGLKADDRYLGILPNSHIYGLVCLVLGPALSGAAVHYIESVSAEAVLGAFASYHPTVLPAVPKVYELFMTQILRKINANPATKLLFKTFFPLCLKKRRKSGSLLGKRLFKSIHEGFGGSLQYLCSAGAPLSKEVADFYYGTGFDILITYGATETNIPTVGNIPGYIRTDSCGKPYPAITLKRSEAGELLIKSPYRMKGYFRDEAATRAAFTEDGFFKTGDLCEIDEAGFVRVTGRSKENIVLPSGKKVTPDDLEEKYAALEGVSEFVICGVPRESADGDEIHAFLVLENDTPENREAVAAQVRARGAGVHRNMRVTKLHFVREIQRTSLQKPKRYLLQQQALKERQADMLLPEAAVPEAESDVALFVQNAVARVADVEPESVLPTTRIFEELSVDSLSSIDLALTIEEHYHVNLENRFTASMTVADLVAALQDPAAAPGAAEGTGTAYPKEKTVGDYLVYAFCRNLARTCYRMRFYGTENVPQNGGFILCANHVAKLDYLYISAAFPKDRFMHLCCMAKKELFRKDPFSKKLIRIAGMVPVDRSGVNMKTMAALKEKLQAGWGVVIHPEGTRSEDGIFRDMKNGAAVLAVDVGVPIVPVYVNGAYAIFPKGAKWFRMFDWRHMRKFPLDVYFGAPIVSEGKDVQALTAEVRDAILELQSAARGKNEKEA